MAQNSPIFTNRKHLTEYSYKTSEKLNTRKSVHQNFTQPQVDFVRWVLNAVPWRGNEVVIDVGCGSGSYLKLAQTYGRFTIAGDLSTGMLKGLAAPQVVPVNLNAQTLPFADQSADIILANHMIYHIPDKNAALAEIQRVLHPDGFLLAATNSATTMPELRRLPDLALERMGAASVHFYKQMNSGFNLENGRALLTSHFSRVTRKDLATALVFPESRPVIDYINSSRDWYESKLPAGISWEALLRLVGEIVQGEIKQGGEFRVQKLSGVFVCQR